MKSDVMPEKRVGEYAQQLVTSPKQFSRKAHHMVSIILLILNHYPYSLLIMINDPLDTLTRKYAP